MLPTEPGQRRLQGGPEHLRVVRSEGDMPEEARGLVEDDVRVEVRPVELDPPPPAPQLQPHAFRVGVRDRDPLHLVERHRNRFKEGIQLDPIAEDAIFLPEVLRRTLRSIDRPLMMHDTFPSFLSSAKRQV
jgi:hypothetical protein